MSGFTHDDMDDMDVYSRPEPKPARGNIKLSYFGEDDDDDGDTTGAYGDPSDVWGSADPGEYGGGFWSRHKGKIGAALGTIGAIGAAAAIGSSRKRGGESLSEGWDHVDADQFDGRDYGGGFIGRG
jgi:hypothetical protein